MAGSGLEGKTLGPYRVLAQISVGGMAKIYKAYQPSMERTVALKVLPEQHAQDPQFVERFYREARTIAQLEHRNILPVYDFGEQDGVTYLAMRFLEGGSLKELMNRRRLSLREAVDILAQVCDALDYAHRQGIVHRDVKPSNVLIDREGAVYLMDFGIAKVLESSSHLTQTGATLGTPAYMSPEQCTGSPVDKRSDIYSLGVVLYEMAVGRVPFQADTPMAVLLAHLHEPLPLPRSINPELPEAIQNIILKAMAKNPADRYQTAAEMGAALRCVPLLETVETAIIDRPVETKPAQPTPEAPPGAVETPTAKPMVEESAVRAEPILPEPETRVEEPSVWGTEAGEMISLPAQAPASQKSVFTVKPKEKRPAMILELGVIIALAIAGVGGYFLLLRNRPFLVAPLPAISPLPTVPLPTQTLPAKPTITPAPTRAPVSSPTNTSFPMPSKLPGPVMIDNFENRFFEGKLNLDVWDPPKQDGCQVLQQEGALMMSSQTVGDQARPDLLDCSAWMKVPLTRGSDLQSMQALFWVDPHIVGDGQRTALAWEADLPALSSTPKGLWLVKCGIEKEKDLRVRMWIQDTRMGEGDIAWSVYDRSLPVQADVWSRVRLQVEPETMTFSCWLNDQLVGMYNPISEREILRATIFRPYLLIVRPPQGRMTARMDELVFLPRDLIPSAAEAARPKEGCIQPPEGIVGWWTGDGTLENLFSPAAGSGEGAWGYAKGMVGQAFAFQNFPSQGGVIYYPPYPSLMNLQNVTVEGWVQIDWGPFKRIDRFLTLGNQTLVIRHDGINIPGTLHFYMKINGELQALSSQRLLKAGRFNHVAGTYDGKTMKLYLDGVLLTSRSVGGNVSQGDATVSLSGSETLDGLLDEMTLYNRALSGEEILAIYRAGEAGKCRR